MVIDSLRRNEKTLETFCDGAFFAVRHNWAHPPSRYASGMPPGKFRELLVLGGTSIESLLGLSILPTSTAERCIEIVRLRATKDVILLKGINTWTCGARFVEVPITLRIALIQQDTPQTTMLTDELASLMLAREMETLMEKAQVKSVQHFVPDPPPVPTTQNYRLEPIEDGFFNDDEIEIEESSADTVGDGLESEDGCIVEGLLELDEQEEELEEELVQSWEDEFGDELVDLPTPSKEKFNPLGDLRVLEDLLYQEPSVGKEEEGATETKVTMGKRKEDWSQGQLKSEGTTTEAAQCSITG
ncbi:hypothetical protein L1987_33010 [Smallanthus sonchifolius]|uniref:Uncharacterized protein n=1 Tax=Smallanthus sonchifolius TaxID=185202 RepID=A0ACB9HQ63_9ASTR|nr:hypothetical protein L1987_33010 [Smallanthus sonchifolius]